MNFFTFPRGESINACYTLQERDPRLNPYTAYLRRFLLLCRCELQTFGPVPNPSTFSLKDIAGVMAHDIPLSDGLMHVRVVGTGRTALFLHGISAHGRSWLEVARILEKSGSNLECWLPDLLGRGKSDSGLELRYKLHDEVRRIKNLAEEFGDNSAPTNFPSIIIGHSHGAAIALAVATAESSVRGLILSNPVTPEVRRPLALEILKIRIARHLIARIISSFHQPLGHLVLRRAGGPHFNISHDLVSSYSQPYREIERARTLLRILADWHPSEIDTTLPKRRFTTHVFAGAHDPRVPVKVAARLASNLDAGLTIVEDGGHVLPEQHPQLLARKIAEIASKVDSGPHPPIAIGPKTPQS